jgi:perosamine synthetase
MIPITRPHLGVEEAAAASEAILSGWLSQGARVERFERVVADYVGARHAIATTNCTTALHLALVAAGIGPGDEVICPSFSFIATANAILHAGAQPIFVDIDPLTYNIDVDQIESVITSRTRAIMPVDQIGLAADIPAVREIADRHELKIIEDAAPSLGAKIGEAHVGGLSHFTCFSFHPRKSITTGEGGIITTNDDEAAATLRRIRSHGASTSDLTRHTSGTTDIEEYPELGYNYRMTDIQGAIGTVQMGRLDEILAKRQALASRYSTLLKASTDALETPYTPDGYFHTYQSYCVWLNTERPRADIMADMAAVEIATRRGVMAIHQEPFYRATFPELSLPVTEEATKRTLLLPLFADMTFEEQDKVIFHLKKAVAG